MSTARPGTAESPRPAPAAGEPPEIVFASADEPASEPPPATDMPEAAVPAWFPRKNGPPPRSGPPPLPAKTEAARPKPVPARLRIEPASEEDEPLPPAERVKRWVLGVAGLSYGISILFHGILLVILALIVYHSLPTDERGTLMVDTREDDEISLDEVDTRIDMPLAKEDLAPPQLQAVPLPDVDSELQLQANLEDILPALGAEGEGSGGGTGLALPRGVNAVTRGSFTAWTIPEDPQPARDYMIVIEIEIPANVKTYRLVDLSGIVVGTDLYTQQIPYDPRNPSSTAAVRDGKPVTLRDVRASVPVKDGRVQLIIRVPGAGELVKDTIKVRSKLLKENQELEIQF